MKVLIACEFSGRVRDAFKKKGHDAWSCDLLPTETPGKHIQDDVLKHLNKGWELMIAHPPCTYLSSVGNAHFNVKKYGDKALQRKNLRIKAMHFFMQLANAAIDKICMENPVGYINSHWRKPDQIVEPFWFGDPEKKKTCLWLKNLPKLEPTRMVEPKVHAMCKGKKIYFTEGINSDRSRLRSMTFIGLAKAMADQWG